MSCAVLFGRQDSQPNVDQLAASQHCTGNKRTTTMARSIHCNIRIFCMLICGLLVVAVSINLSEQHQTALQGANGEARTVERKITIIVADGDETTTTTTTAKPSPAAQPEESDGSSGCRKQKRNTTFKIDEATKLIYIDKDSESGYLIGEIESGIGDSASANAADDRAKHPDTEENQQNVRNQPPQVERHSSGGAANFSVFLVSRHPEHIAILLDIEEIDFEPTINCENQEIRFSIIGEISKQLLSQKENGSESPDSRGPAASSDESPPSATDGPEADEESSSQQQETSVAPPLPVSEAMSLLLNSPLNKTILDNSDETNDFKIIESTIDYLHEKTCNDLIALHEAGSAHDSRTTADPKPQQQHEHQQQQQRQRAKGQARRGGRKSERGRDPSPAQRGRKRHRHQAECPQESAKFKTLMSMRLKEYFEWDEFKIVCGKTKQLVIPMRSLRVGVYSDEFSPNSSFRLRYKFISDPTLLPAFDNGMYYCRNRNIIDLALKCNGIDDCGDASDESIKTCGYPSGRNGEPTSALATSSSSSTQNSRSDSPTNSSSHHSTYSSGGKRRLTYVNGDVLHCCQSSEWLSLMPHNQATGRLQLQSLIGESMNLFSGPIFAPTRQQQQQTSSRAKGKRRVKRIVGGGVAQRGMWPGHASLQYELLEPLCHFCAGTLIHPQYVLTAGHCITKDGLARGIKVVFGAHDLRQTSGNHIQVRYVDDAHIYPGVDVKQLRFDWENDMNNDIALLRLNAPVLVTPHVAPACLPPYNRPLAVNTTCRSIGWGQTHGSGSSNLLKHLSLRVVDSSHCSKELIDQENGDRRGTTTTGAHSLHRRNKAANGGGRARRVGDHFESTSLDQYSDRTMVCVKNDLGHGICQGDSGGPLYCDRLNSSGEKCTEIYGVASFIIQYATVGAMCAVENLPEIFGEVSSKTEWISSTMKMFEQTYKLRYS